MAKSKAIPIASLIFALFFWVPLLNMIFGAVAVYLGIKSIRKIQKEPLKYSGKWIAAAGIALGALPLALYIIGIGMCLYGHNDVCTNIGASLLAQLA